MATSAHFHPHIPRIQHGLLSKESLTYGWPHRAAAALLVAVGVAFIVVTFSTNLFRAGPALDRTTNDFRPFMTTQAIQTDRQDIAALSGAGTEIQTKMLPALARLSGVSPTQLSTGLASQYPAVFRGLAAIPQVTPQFNSLVTTLDQQRPYFRATDEIPTSSLPAASMPWTLLAVGLVSIGLGAVVWYRPRGAAIGVAVLGALLVAVPLALNLPHKASYADQLNSNLKPIYTQQMITEANTSLAALGSMGSEMQTRMLPGLATQLHMTPAQVQQLFLTNFPTTSAALASMPTSLGRFQRLVGTFQARLSDHKTLAPVSLEPIVWFTVGAGGALLLLGAAGVAIGWRTTRT